MDCAKKISVNLEKKSSIRTAINILIVPVSIFRHI